MPEPRVRPGLTIQAVIGFIAIFYGLLLTADNLGWIEAGHVLRFWPIGIVLIGAVMFSRASDGPGRTSASIVLGVGVWLTAGKVFGWGVSIGMLWPLLLIAAGVSIVMRARRADQDRTIASDHRFSDLAFWSGIKRRITSPLFKRADFTAVMGGVDLDLRAAGLAGGEAVVDVFIVMGGMEIRVPPDWAVSNQIVAVMAGVDDRSTGTQAATNRLILRGFVMMGGVEIKT